MEAECKLSIREFFSKDKYFYVPTYQRGYKWGVPVSEKPEECAVSILLNDIKNAIDQDEYFIQGVTVAEEDENIILIDGQQRITTFFLILLILLTDDADDRKTFLFKDGNSKLKYAIRNDSQDYINSLLGLMEYSKDVNEYQDTFYFQKCIDTVKSNIEEDEKETIKSFILEKVKLFYISVIIFALLLLYIGRRSFFIFLILPFVALYTRSYKGISVKKFVLFAITFT